MKKHLLASMVAAATISVLTPLTSHAFGLGKINVISALNEPFKAEIPVTALKPEEKGNLQVKMASQSEFDRAGLNRSMLVNQMQFDIVESAGQHKILITSKQAIREPFLDFLVTATAGAGIILREYTVLLDPPEYVLAEIRPASSRPAPSPVASTETVTRASTTTYQYADSSSFSGSSYTVKRSDTLWNVALQTRPAADLTVHQMMMALLKRNPSAFNNENVNGLKAGVTLQIPSRSEIEALSHAAARQAFAEQTEAWKNRNKPAPAVQVAQALEETETTESSTTSAETTEAVAETEQSSTTTETAQTTVAGPESRLQLLAPDEVSQQQDASPNVQGDSKLQELTEQLTFAQETIEAQAQENIDLQQRMALLEEQIETMRRMISIEDTDLARMQAMLEEDSATVTELPVDGAEQGATTEDTVEQQQAATTAEVQNDTTDLSEDAASGSATESEQTEATDITDSAAAANEVDSVISKAAQTLNLDEAEVRSTIDKVKMFVAENKLPTALGLLLVLLILWLIVRRSSREVTWDEAVRKMDKADSKKTTATVVTTDLTDDLSASIEEEQPSEEKTAAELIEQADMFVGYADYVQAKSSLEQARTLEPANSLIAYKTLFVLYKLNQTDEFIELVEETEFDNDSLEWSEIREWGRELAPGHALFNQQNSTVEEQEDELDVADLNFNEPETETETATKDVTDDELKLNLDAETDSVEEVVEPEQADSGSIEFNFDDFSASNAAVADESISEADNDTTEQTPSRDIDDDLLSFDTNFGNAESETDESLNIDINNTDDFDNNISFDAEADSVDDADSFELGSVEMSADSDAADLEFDIGDLDDIDEAETKLDLAAAYVDMGDPDGARSILNEVLDEGSDEQRKRANDLLASLG
jgi:pilus assembly protein FimV